MSSSDAKIVNQKDKDAADLMTWRDYEALRNEMRREFRIEDDELRGTVQEISQKLDATNETVTTMTDQMTDIQRSLQALQLAVENLTQQQQQEEAEDNDEAPGRGVGRGNRPRGWAELGRQGRGLDEENGLGKPKFSIPKFEGGADVEEYLTWELKIEKLWRLHNYTEDRKIKLASSEFDGYALQHARRRHGHAQSASSPANSVDPALAPNANRNTTPPCSTRTCPLARGNAVADELVDDVRHGLAAPVTPLSLPCLKFTAITRGVTVVTSPSDERQRQCSGAAVATSL
ncbi:hypothetical protein QYE76_011033 [Lolium multiflorum]|uniref:Uncharacterized protein n=1 Tax=Lolium multiflorum TaxID=4521 RepID=A0AAD8X2N1_LOLMU|nr:hypothetical protein QYE76_011033 [Lolium multiflorum]